MFPPTRARITHLYRTGQVSSLEAHHMLVDNVVFWSILYRSTLGAVLLVLMGWATCVLAAGIGQ